MLGIGADIDYVLSSCSVGWQKPHPAMFRRALDLAGASPEEAVVRPDAVIKTLLELPPILAGWV